MHSETFTSLYYLLYLFLNEIILKCSDLIAYKGQFGVTINFIRDYQCPFISKTSLPFISLFPTPSVHQSWEMSEEGEEERKGKRERERERDNNSEYTH